VRKTSFDKNHTYFERWVDWYGNFLDNHLYKLSQFEQHELLEAFVLKIAVKWEVLAIQDMITSLNRDSTRYSAEIGLKLRKHLTKDESEAILIGHRYIDFKSVGEVKKFAKKHLADKFNPFKLIDNDSSKKIDHFFAIRNYLAHYSSYSKRKYKAILTKDYNLRRKCEPGVFLSKVDKKTQLYRWVDFINTFLIVSRSMMKI